MSDALVLMDPQNPCALSNPLTIARMREAANMMRPHMMIIWANINWFVKPCAPFKAKNLVLTGDFNTLSTKEPRNDYFAPVIQPEPEDWVFPKGEASIFRNSSMDDFLRAHGVRRIDYAGLTLSDCIFRSARNGVDLGYKTRIWSNVTADKNDAGCNWVEHAFAGLNIAYQPLSGLTI